MPISFISEMHSMSSAALCLLLQVTIPGWTTPPDAHLCGISYLGTGWCRGEIPQIWRQTWVWISTLLLTSLRFWVCLTCLNLIPCSLKEIIRTSLKVMVRIKEDNVLENAQYSIWQGKPLTSWVPPPCPCFQPLYTAVLFLQTHTQSGHSPPCLLWFSHHLLGKH